jgi:hypothetical protein
MSPERASLDRTAVRLTHKLVASASLICDCVCLARNLPSVVLALLDNKVSRAAFDHGFDLRLLMLRTTPK